MAKTAKTPPKQASVTTAKKKTVKTVNENSQIKSKPIPKPVVEPSLWNGIYVFGQGETLLTGKGLNIKAPNDSLNSLDKLVEHLASKQNKGTKITLKDTHTILIINKLAVDFRPKSVKNKGQRFLWRDIEPKMIEKLATEILKKQ